MTVVRAKVLGFCMGVRRAVGLARAEAENRTGRVYTLGPLIHNPQALEDLESRGVETLDADDPPPDLGGASVIIRAHGVSPEIEDDLRKRGAVLIDATCPRVKASQLKARSLAEAGRRLFLAGEKSHAEIAGILGYAKAGPFCAVVGDAAEAFAAAERLAAEGGEGGGTALIGQTTISEGEYRDVAAAIAGFFPDLEVAGTICAATRERRDGLRGLLDKVDAVVVVGGRESANTRRLLAIAESAGKPCVLAETAREIPDGFFGFDVIGVAAGASTPDAVIDEVERVLLGGRA